MARFQISRILDFGPIRHGLRTHVLVIMKFGTVLPDNVSLSLGKRLHFRGPTLPVIAVATSEVGPAVLLFVEEVCQVL